MTQELTADRPSLEGLVETGLLKLDSLHPGGLGLTRELAELCNIREGALVLDVACGTGETACFLAEGFGARVWGIDHSEGMIRQAQTKAQAKGLKAEFAVADAARVPFNDATFDAAICECTLCFLDKAQAIAEMARVVRPGGRVGMHDLCWIDETPDRVKRALAQIEGERPETLEGWRRLFARAGLDRITSIDKSGIMAPWMRHSRKQLGLSGQLSLAFAILRRWGVAGAWQVFRSERIFSSGLLGYGIVAGTRL